MNRASIIALLIVVAGSGLARGQFGGNASYGRTDGRSRAEQAEQAKRVLTETQLPPDGSGMFVEANVLMNVAPDRYIAVFGVVAEAATVPECGRKMDETLASFDADLKALGINDEDRFVDWVAQHKVYRLEVEGDIAREVLAGFELKKNVLIQYEDRDLLDTLVAAAARSQIFDLIKIDTIVDDVEGVRETLAEEAGRVLQKKAARFGRLLGVRLRPPAQVYAERPATYFPAAMYDSYAAFEAEQLGSDSIRQRYAVQTARKTRTFYYNGLDAADFDAVLNPVSLEPPVQFTLYLKVRYAVEPAEEEE